MARITLLRSKTCLLDSNPCSFSFITWGLTRDPQTHHILCWFYLPRESVIIAADDTFPSPILASLTSSLRCHHHAFVRWSPAPVMPSTIKPNLDAWIQCEFPLVQEVSLISSPPPTSSELLQPLVDPLLDSSLSSLDASPLDQKVQENRDGLSL